MKFEDHSPLTPFEWENRYQAALLETDRSQLPQKIMDAETAMFKRKLELGKAVALRDLLTNAEMKAINRALSNLVVLRNELQS